MNDPILQAQFRETLLRLDPRYSDPKRLCKFAYKVYSQDDTDGALAELFRRIGTDRRNFIEIGVENGLECNTLHLLVQGWSGHWIDSDEKSMSQIQGKFGMYLGSTLHTRHQVVSAENANTLLSRLCPDGALDLLSIDIDGNDYWVWNAITSVQPRVVVLEYNAAWRPPLSIAIEYNPRHKWDGTNYFGASLSALASLGEKKGYSLVGCSFAGVNAYFVRNDLCGGHFAEPFTAENHYEPPRYWMIGPAGHPPGFGRISSI
ncbi:MAG TPA: hypothetical protein VG322_15035 [Candidatus Acidoferrales bacterium]|nr:hypothetical protein [Candidatus Acidoferrales bacterium]